MAEAGAAPQPAEAPAVLPMPFTTEELATCMRVLELLAEDGELTLYKSPQLKRLRKVLAPFAHEMNARMYGGGKSRGQYRDEFEDKIAKKSFEQRHRALDKAVRNKRELRSKRVAALKRLEESGVAAQLLIPDGVADDSSLGAMGPAQPALLTDGAAVEEVAEAAGAAAAAAAAAEPDSTFRPQACYICKARYRELHHFYDNLCPACASLNYEKRLQTADLRGRYALVTGARVKIGYHVALKLLRAGAHVIALTRFPHDAALRFAREKDYGEWRELLHVYGLDLRDVPRVEAFCAALYRCYPQLDIIVNNACQTIRRPPAYYQHMLETEMRPLAALPEAVQEVLDGPIRQHFPRVLGHDGDSGRHALGARGAGSGGVPLVLDAGGADGEADAEELAPSMTPTVLERASPVGGAAAAAALGADVPSALKSQVALVAGDDAAAGGQLFPAGALDVNSQQVDLRTRNSWVLKLEEVPTAEAAEVLAVNTLAPFVLNSRLRALMERGVVDASAPRFIVNVSAMEGKFYRFKTPNHPHTNMAKAALNMMTRTSAGDYARSHIYMNSVDTGWINDENPLERTRAKVDKLDFQTPIDEVDAAARILDPVFAVANGTTAPMHGKFLKDYKETEW